MRRVMCAVALLALVVAPTGAQEQPPAVPAQLTLEEALELARRHNPQYLQVANNEEVAAAQVRSNYGTFMPRLNASTGASSNWSRSLSAFGDFGEPLEQPEPITSRTSSSSWGVSSSMTLFDGGRMFANLASARAGERLADAEIANQFNTLRADVARAYFDAVKAERLVALEQQLLAFAEDRVQITQEQFRIAAASQTDVLGARGDIASQRASLSRAEAQSRTTKLDLLQQLGVRGEIDFTPTTELRPAVDPTALDADALVTRALGSSPAVRMAAARTVQAEKAASASHGSRWPTISVSGGYNRGSSQRGLFDAWGKFAHDNQGASLSLAVSLPVFQGFTTSYQIAQAEAGADDARQAERQARIQAERDVRAAVIGLRQAYEALQLAEEQADLSAQRLELAQEQYRAGVQSMDFTNLQQIVQQNQNAQRQALEARFAYQAARILLEQQLGAPLEGGA